MALCNTKKFIKLLFLDVSIFLKAMFAFAISISLLTLLLCGSIYVLDHWLKYVCDAALFILFIIICSGLIAYAKNLCQKSLF